MMTHTHLFLMRSLIHYYLTEFFTALFAPFYFHFGHSVLLIELTLLAAEFTDIVATYYLYFFILAVVIFFRNSSFLPLLFTVFRKYNLTEFRLSFFNYFLSFWNNLKTFFNKK